MPFIRRIIVRQLLLILLKRNPQLSPGRLTETSTQIILKLATQIAASVPPMLGLDLNACCPGLGLAPAVQSEAPIQPRLLMAQTIMWPLFIFMHCPLLTSIQRTWARGRLVYIREEVGLRRAGKLLGLDENDSDRINYEASGFWAEENPLIRLVNSLAEEIGYVQ